MSFAPHGVTPSKHETLPGHWSCGLGSRLAANRRRNDGVAAPNIHGAPGGRALPILFCAPAFLIQSESCVPDPKSA